MLLRTLAALFFIAFGSAALAQVGQGPTPPIAVPNNGGTYPNGFTITGSSYYARDPQYGNCTWSTAGGADAGPCINAAITAAATAGGGTIMLPSGSFNVATTIINGTSGVHIQGAGVGYIRDSNTPSAFVPVTRLIWTGTAGATMFIETPSGSRSLYSVDVWGVTFDCASRANICAEFQAVSTSFINIGASEPRTIGVWFTTLSSSFADGPGSQDNDIWLQARSTSASFSPTGILFDGAATSSFDSSVNRIHMMLVWLAKGDGIVMGYSDHNYIETAITYYDPVNQGGTAMVFANSLYVQKNGIAVAGQSNENRLYQNETVADVNGLWNGSAITPGTHTGSEAVTTLTATLTSPTPNLSQTLTVSGGFGNVVAGMTASCSPNGFCGIIAGNPVTAISGTTATLGSQTNGITNGTVITFSYGVTQYAVPGTYTLTFTGATTANLTAPSGGHTQTGITLTNGNLVFTDMVIPFSGTPANNDTYTIVVPTPPKNTQILNTDKGNSVPNPTIEPGSGLTTFVSTTASPFTSNFTNTAYTPSSPVLVSALPATAVQVRFILTGQGGCGGGGAAIAASGSGSGGGGGGGAGVFDNGWFPDSYVSGNYTIAFGTQCTAASAGASGGAGGNTTLAMSGLGGGGSNTITAFGGGGGSVGANGGASGGGGGGGTIGAGSSTTNGTGGGAGNFGATAGGSGIGGTNNTAGGLIGIGGSGGGGASATGVIGNGGFSEYGGSTGGGSGGGCNAGAASVGGFGYAPIYLNHVGGGANTGGAGVPGIAAAANGSGAGIGGGGGGGGGGNSGTSTVGGAGAAGGQGGGGGGGGGSACGNTTTGGVGGVGGTPQVIVMTQ